MSLSASSEDSNFLAKADRIGIGASVLCAIHCAAAPFLLLLLPAFGKTGNGLARNYLTNRPLKYILPSHAFRRRTASDKSPKSPHMLKMTPERPPNDPKSIPK